MPDHANRNGTEPTRSEEEFSPDLDPLGVQQRIADLMILLNKSSSPMAKGIGSVLRNLSESLTMPSVMDESPSSSSSSRSFESASLGTLREQHHHVILRVDFDFFGTDVHVRKQAMSILRAMFVQGVDITYASVGEAESAFRTELSGWEDIRNVV